MNDLTDKSLLVVGECMMELSGSGDTYHRAFAGDTYNSAVYAKRWHAGLDVQILTAIGSDPVSAAMVAQWDRDHVGHSLVMQSAQAQPGLYAITTDNEGERSFTYWRKDSAATQFMALMTDTTRAQLARFDYIFFSGITLAILADDDKARFLALITDLQAQGKTIAFDPNYRPTLWRDRLHATEWLTEAYRLTDIALPGLADHQEIFGHQNRQTVADFMQTLDVKEFVVKADSEGVFGHLQNHPPVHMAITPERNPLDTTGAGDSFAGTYLAQRMLGASIETAMHSAAAVARLVVQHRGAIVDAGVYEGFRQQNPR